MSRVPKRVRMPWRPIVGLGEGSVIRLAPGDFWRVDYAGMAHDGGADYVYLALTPVEPGDVLTGFGEFIDLPPVDLEEV